MEPADPDFYKIGYVRSVRAYGVDFKKGPDGFGVYASNDIEPLQRARDDAPFGPPGLRKTTLLKGLTGKLDSNIRVSGKITYCGHELNEFVPQRTCAYISQHDLHYGEMTVRENLDFSGRCLGVGTRYEMLAELSRHEKGAGIKPDPGNDAFMKATALAGQKTSLVTDYILKILGLDIYADIMVGDDMRRGISGGQKNVSQLTVPTIQIVKFMKQIVHIMDVAMIISLLQPPPKKFDLFDDVILLSEGQFVYQGPRENVLEFFEIRGFKCPDRKGVADFLQGSFKSFRVGQQIFMDLTTPYDKSRAHPAALVRERYEISNMGLFRACFAREWLLMKRNSFVYIFKTTHLQSCRRLPSWFSLEQK
ncbi:hypothetical protein GIB67_020189 [Kingdonia uniflora]|uniref:ABC transporter domain-containing protein n=1 Tax=Kingdonia uniflora TaxID=39325 RepID=A0A7J7NTU9_9MAGN|nr:hypothetical protein GIB67_020189 [Kingdonia uniflora]